MAAAAYNAHCRRAAPSLGTPARVWARLPRHLHPATAQPQTAARRKSIIAALTSAGRSRWVKWPQPGSMIVPRN